MKKTLLALSIPYLLSAHSIPELFDALKSHAQTKSDEMVVKKAEVAASQATSQLYPTISLFGTYDNYSSPTNMKPIAPNVMKQMLVDNAISQPYSYNIYKGGAQFTMPIFVKSIYTMADKAKAMQKSAQAKKHINLLQNEALIVGSNANLQYLHELKRSLELKEKSLLETQKTLKIKVDNGRAPASALYKIDDGLNQVSIAKNNIDLQKQKLISSIEAITGIKLDVPVDMQEVSSVKEGELGSLKPLEEKLRASRLEVNAEKEKLYPSVVAHGSYAYSSATAYNNNKDVNEEYGDIGVVINIPLLAMSQYDSIKKSKIELRSDEVELEKLREELSAKADMLKSSLPLLDNSIKLSQKSIENKEKLLQIAKVNYKSGRLSTEEYLRYEDDVVDAKAKLYQAKAQKWQTQMQLAVIYANNIEEMVK
ncbi:TolC family protein [Sulfurimonas paralvinellae]|uniref:TolC family protein n=1 Tax=Sulfurimonas paralvinellae TaxID=317658 RepID=A0A7M1B7Y7_9BACT|nr:TolC family protein [Sulfurimonas paralvinellae]QOP45820.1 TolC family protein [Sulfurimonas paralvinellae]